LYRTFGRKVSTTFAPTSVPFRDDAESAWGLQIFPTVSDSTDPTIVRRMTMSTKSDIKGAIDTAADKAKGAASATVDAARDAADKAKDTAKDAAQTVGQTVKKAGEKIKDQAD